MHYNPEFLNRTYILAKRGGTTVSPNPMVGAVVVVDNQIIGEGWHEVFGGPHAEVNAIRQVKNKALLKNATLYVSLEPCNHYGKTPPCTSLIIESEIPKVVIGSLDPNPLVSGKGVKKLQECGIEVVINENPEIFHQLNKHFFLNQTLQRPWITLKWAQSADGFIGKVGQEISISDSLSKIKTHQLRSNHQAIWIGTNTAITDEPSLNCRNYPGKNAIKIFSDRELKISKEILQKTAEKSIVITEKKEADFENIEYLIVDSVYDLKDVLSRLYVEKNIGSILVEGGAKLLQSLIDSDVVDEMYIIQNAKKLLERTKENQFIHAPKVLPNFYLESTEKWREDTWLHLIKMA